MFQLAVLDDYQGVALSSADWSSLEGRAEITIFRDTVADPDALAARLRPFDGLMLMRERTRIDATLLANLPNLRLIVTTGVRNAAIDVAAARARGVIVCGTPAGGSDASTAALAWALILALARRLPGEVQSVRKGDWQSTVGVDLDGRTLGLVGLGRIGERMARIGAAFGMSVIAWSPNLNAERGKAGGAVAVEKAELFATADVISLHLVLSERTRGVVGAGELAAMKSSAFIINTARGGLIDEPALIAALDAGRLAGAGLDVFETEPLPANHPLRRRPTVVATPHLGFVTGDIYRAGYSAMIENVAAFLDGVAIRELAAD